MIGSSHRFHGHNSLRVVYQHGQTVRSPKASLRYLSSNRSTGYRAAVVVSRKVHKSAVERNRIRRRIYALVTKQPLNATYDLVFTVFEADLSDMPSPQLEQLIVGLLRKAKLTVSPESHAIVKKMSKEV